MPRKDIIHKQQDRIRELSVQAGRRGYGVSSLVNESEPSFHVLFSFRYTSVTTKGLVTSFPPT